MRLRIQGYSQIIIMIIIIGIACITPLITDPSMMFFLCCLVFFMTMVDLLRTYKSNITILCFYFSMFAFLIGGDLCKILGWTERKYVFTDEVDCHAYYSILLSVVALYVTYVISSSTAHKATALRSYTERPDFVPYRKTSLVLYYCLSIFKVIKTASAVAFAKTYGYTNYYTEYSFNGPNIVLKLSNMSTICFFVFLATMPSKKETKKPMILFLILSAVTLLIGYRNEFVVNVLLVLIYLITRDMMSDQGEQWISKKIVIAAIILTPVMLTALYAFSRSRINVESGFNIFDGVINFFDQQGFSINVIKWEKELHDSIPSRPYSIGQLCDFFTSGNVISKFLFSIEPYRGQTVERALNGNQLSYYLSYMKFPWDYSKGYGVGSSFIAEAFHDLGYFGIVLFSAIYGFIFARYKAFIGKSVWVTALFFLSITKLLMAPRSYADAFVAQILDLTNIEAFLIIFLIAKVMWKRPLNGQRGLSKDLSN